MTRNRRPNIGQSVLVYDKTLDREIEGTVTELLDTQFTYSEKLNQYQCHTHYCFYSDNWNTLICN